MKTFTAAFLIAVSASALAAPSPSVEPMPWNEPSGSGYIRDISTRMVGNWAIVPKDTEYGSTTAERFDLLRPYINEADGSIRFASGKNAYSCTVSLWSGSHARCTAAFEQWEFVGSASGTGTFTGQVRYDNGAVLPALMVKVD